MFWEQFWPSLLSTIIGFLLASAVTLLAIYLQTRHEQRLSYISTLRTLISELKDNQRVLSSDDKFILTTSESTQRILLTVLGKSALDGALSSERLNSIYSSGLSDDLVLLARKISLHNMMSAALFDKIHDRSNEEYLNWVIENLNTNQSIITQDLATLLPVIADEIKKYGNKTMNSKFYTLFLFSLFDNRRIDK